MEAADRIGAHTRMNTTEAIIEGGDDPIEVVVDRLHLVQTRFAPSRAQHNEALTT